MAKRSSTCEHHKRRCRGTGRLTLCPFCSAPGDVVLGKIKGYPPWPGIVSGLHSSVGSMPHSRSSDSQLVDEDNVPKGKVLRARPGKSYFIVRFFPAAD